MLVEWWAGNRQIRDWEYFDDERSCIASERKGNLAA